VLKNYDDPRHKPVSAARVREELAEKQRREEEERQRPVKEAEAQLTATHRQLVEMGREAFRKQQPDPEWVTPASAFGLSMSLEKAKAFVASESQRFVNESPSFFRCDENKDMIFDYIFYQRPEIKIPNADCFKAAWLRLRELGLIKEKPEEVSPTVEAEPQVEPEPVHFQPDEELTQGWDVKTGEPRNYTPREIHHMSAEQFRHAFKLYGDRGPLMRKPLL
jgi:hypothetical protein